MNNGMYGFPPGPKATYRELIFDSSDTYYPNPNCKFIIIDMSGGGGGGTTPAIGAASGGIGGCGGTPFQGIFAANLLGRSNAITIGSGGTAGTNGNDTIITNNDTGVELMRVMGGRTGSNTPYTIHGTAVVNGFRGGQGQGASGNVGGQGSGGGGGGQALGVAGFTGGRPSSMLFLATTFTVADRGGGGATNGGGGQHAPPATRTVRGYGEGGGGGGRITGGFASNGGNGIRGSGGGGGGTSTTQQGIGGTGGNGFIRILEVSFP